MDIILIQKLEKDFNYLKLYSKIVEKDFRIKIHYSKIPIFGFKYISITNENIYITTESSAVYDIKDLYCTKYRYIYYKQLYDLKDYIENKIYKLL